MNDVWLFTDKMRCLLSIHPPSLRHSEVVWKSFIWQRQVYAFHSTSSGQIRTGHVLNPVFIRTRPEMSWWRLGWVETCRHIPVKEGFLYYLRVPRTFSLDCLFSQWILSADNLDSHSLICKLISVPCPWRAPGSFTLFFPFDPGQHSLHFYLRVFFVFNERPGPLFYIPTRYITFLNLQVLMLNADIT